MSTLDWITVALHALAEGVSAAITAGREKRARITGEAPDLHWRERQAATDSAAKGGA